ncbi:MAG: class I SAM-dependent methyltransferase [Candidatus Omnitrophota bacterium]|jgi:2-polyprenyl-3-methyl-5-hydroxy-6-metoxy-1,4-benzoquinol methylase|nr:MAG: class I SAM-dependent methyltransferase [Candidatus Omnitrophota bacterium]
MVHGSWFMVHGSWAYNKDILIKNIETHTFNTDPHSPHSIILGLMPTDTAVLDVGCNSGYIGKWLIKNKNCVVDGIDIEECLLSKAKENGYRNTYRIDLSSNTFSLPGFKYDQILFVDILEHLPEPSRVLNKFIKENLKNKGKIIISIPNIARIEYRLRHLFGNFDYDNGIMHSQHLRFFTMKTAIRMIEQSGCKIIKIIPTGLGHRLNILTKLTAFQFIFICTHCY